MLGSEQMLSGLAPKLDIAARITSMSPNRGAATVRVSSRSAMLMARVPCVAGIAAVSPDRKNEDEPQSLRSMQIRWGNGFQCCHNFHRPTQAFGDFGHSCEQRSDRCYPWHRPGVRPGATTSSPCGPLHGSADRIADA